MTACTTRGQALIFILYAARMKKNLPLLLLPISGTFTAGPERRPDVLALGLGVLLIVSAFMTHINILTDAELDRDKKPHLLLWLTADVALMKAVLGLELVLVVAGLGVLAWLGAPQVCLGLAVFTAITTLYSYNFLAPSRPVEARLKARWWGHFAVCQGAYMCLWYAGHFCAHGSSWATFREWLPIFCLVSLSEYSLFLSESAIDASEERKAGLRTFATLLGRQWSSVLALGVWCLSAIGLGTCLLLMPPGFMQGVVAMAILPAIAMRGIVEVMLVLPRAAWRDDALRSTLPDAVFFGSRIFTAAALLAMM
jgi:4-hydroxybenzoate polyprenyltransferase